MKKLLIVILGSLIASTALAAKYYVKPLGSDLANGLTELTAWQHVMKACSTVVAGDTVLIRAGRYDETSNLNGSAWGSPVQRGLVPTNKGTVNAYIVFKGYPGDTKPIIIGKYGTGAGYTTVATHRMGALLDGSDHYITYDSLEFRFGPTGIFLTGSGPHDIIIRNCVIDSMLGLGGAPADDNAGGVMTYTNGYNGNLNGATVQRNITVEGCEIFAIGAWSGSTPNYTHFYNTGGIYNYCCDSCLFRNNNIHHTAAGIEFKEPARYTEVYGNVIHDVAISMWDRFLGSGASYGYNGPDRVMARWHHNTSYHSGVCFMLGTGSVNGTLQDTLVYFYNNTCDCDSAVYYGTAYGINWPQRGGVNGQHGNYDSAFFFNNIFYNGPSTRYAACDDHDYSFGLTNCTFPVSHLYEDYNMFYGLGTSGTYFGRNSTGYTLAQWQTGSPAGFVAGQGANDRIADPLFVNRAARDYRLQPTSPALTGGKGGSFTFFQGSNRQATVVLPTYLGALGPTTDTSISITNASASEGSNMIFTITLSSTTGPLANQLNFTINTTNGTAQSATDFLGITNGVGTIDAGALTGQITVTTFTDALTEGNETFTITISNPTIGRIGQGVATGTIIDIPPVTPTAGKYLHNWRK